MRIGRKKSIRKGRSDVLEKQSCGHSSEMGGCRGGGGWEGTKRQSPEDYGGSEMTVGSRKVAPLWKPNE